MAMTFFKSVGLLFKVLRRGTKSHSYKLKVEAYNKEFLKQITDPNFEDGRIHQIYQEGLSHIRKWYE